MGRKLEGGREAESCGYFCAEQGEVLMKKPVWKTKDPTKMDKKLSPGQKASAKAAAKKAGRPYPNLVDNLQAARKK
jgi:ribosomal protein L15E